MNKIDTPCNGCAIDDIEFIKNFWCRGSIRNCFHTRDHEQLVIKLQPTRNEKR